ncbi:MAG: HAMP domain-containing sensor histidine kinase [Dongiaceae bacterium]
MNRPVRYASVGPDMARKGMPAVDSQDGKDGTDGAGERRRLQARICALEEAVAARDQFLSLAAHELRNPMTPLLMQIQALRRHAARLPPERLALTLERLELIVERFIRRATILLDVSRLTSGRFVPEPAGIDLAQLVREVAGGLALLADRARCELRLSVAAGLTAVTDRLAVEQILENLLTNAIKYGAARPIELTLAAEGSRARLAVRDHGIGISAADRARIFERFERAVSREQRSGFGIGLWVVGRLVEAIGGEISIESRIGEGSTFTVLLPLCVDQRAP